MQVIADSLGVSKGTVSLVLSGKAGNNRVSAELTRKILNKAKELNYQPNELARSLRTGHSNTIGLIVADISNVFFGNFVYYIQEHLRKYKYSVITVNTNESAEQFAEVSNILINRQVDGIIAVPADGGAGCMAGIMDRNIPLVQIDRYFPEVSASCVVLDNYSASYRTTERLISEGCRRICLVKYRKDVSVNTERTAGFVDAMKAHGLFDDSLIKEVEYSNEEDIRDDISRISCNREDADALFFTSHKLFLSGVSALVRKKVRIPDDIKVACFDKNVAFSLLDFPFIYIEQPVKEMAEKAVDLLIEHIRGDREVRKCVFDARISIN